MQTLKECVRKHCALKWKLPIIHSRVSQNLQLIAKGNKNLLFVKFRHTVDQDTFSSNSISSFVIII
jgi:hypothetical protein